MTESKCTSSYYTSYMTIRAALNRDINTNTDEVNKLVNKTCRENFKDCKSCRFYCDKTCTNCKISGNAIMWENILKKK